MSSICIIFSLKMENMNTNNLEDIGESPDKFDVKRISTFFVSNLIRSGDFILNEEFLDMISCYYGDSGKSFPEEVKKIIKNFLLKKRIKKKKAKKIINIMECGGNFSMIYPLWQTCLLEKLRAI